MKTAVRILCLLMGLQLGAFFAMSYIVFKTKPIFLIYLICMIPLSFIADFFLWREIRRNADLILIRLELEKKEERTALEEQYIKRQKQWKQEFCATRELLRGKLSGIISMMKEITLDEHDSVDKGNLRCLLADMENTLIQTRETHYCDHMLSNIILCEKTEEAKEKQIEIQVKTSVPDGLLPSDNEWCSIWCNLLDNAIEACGRMEKGQQWIQVKAAAVDGYFYIKVENSFNPKKVSANTSKKDYFNHGFGRTILKELAEKYDGGFEEKPDKECYRVIFTIVDKRGN